MNFGPRVAAALVASADVQKSCGRRKPWKEKRSTGITWLIFGTVTFRYLVNFWYGDLPLFGRLAAFLASDEGLDTETCARL